MDFTGLTYHAYDHAPVAGWQGYYEDPHGKVVAWVAMDGEVVPDSEIK